MQKSHFKSKIACKRVSKHFQLEGYRVLVLYCSGADPTVCLPEPDCVVIPSGGQDHWVTPDCALVYIHG